jgi:polysaccharide deacetylase 2 family uncharacterized protein YibQ
LNNFFKKLTIAVTLIVSFYIIFYIIFNLLFISNTSYKLGSKIIPYIEYKNDNIVNLFDTNNTNQSTNTTSKPIKVLQENIDNLKMIESFNPSIKDDIDKNIKKNKTIIKKENNQKPKIVIIIDDIQFPYQVRLLKKINLNITPSFLPSISNKKQANNLINKFSSYMIHLPLEAKGDGVVEKNTLNTNASLMQIQKVISKAHRLFPKAHYLNNHTGSKFTSDIKAMKKLAIVLKDNNIKFIDSVTDSTTKAQEVFDYEIYKRNIFLDHFDDLKYIKQQIKKAIKLSKTKKLLILLGHPRKNTLTALSQYQELLQKEVDVVFIDDL